MYRTGPLEGSGPGDCGVGHGPVPPLHAAPHTPRVRRATPGPWSKALEGNPHLNVGMTSLSGRGLVLP